MAKFSPKNFPADHGNKRFSGAGERTIYVPTSKAASFKYKSGFPLEKDTILYGKNGKQIKTLRKKTIVHFTHPAKLYKNDELMINQRGTFAAISTKGFNKAVEGFVPISAVIKPGGGTQNRVVAGAATQKLIADKVEQIAFKQGKNYEFISTARPGSTAPDLVVSINGKNIQFEIKGTSSASAPVTFFDKSVSRTKKIPELIDEIAKVFIARNAIRVKNKTFIGS